jgi:uncharacterized protein (UPF0264 family)
MPSQDVRRSLSLGEFRRIALDEARRQLQQAYEKKESEAAGGFVRRVPPPLITTRFAEEVYQDLVKFANEDCKKYPDLLQIATSTKSTAHEILILESAERLLIAYRQLLNLYGIKDEGQDRFSIQSDKNGFVIASHGIQDDAGGAPSWAIDSDRDDQALVAAVVNLLAASRRAERSLSADEHTAVLSAYRLLEKSAKVPSAYLGIGVYGFRKHQTCLSVANPGEGHVVVTCSSQRLLDGTVVHIEHIDRDGERDREKLEPYRLPAAINAARVRLHAGSSAPCTAYVGRPIFESGDVKRDMLKSVHMTASSCTAMFMNGVADCKIGIERMTATQAINFMRAVAGNAVRDQTRQYLSAAFNINLPVIDDRDGSPVSVATRPEIAKLAIELALAGRFEKVTWDGSSNQEPSIPIIEQLPFHILIGLVHSAHEKGLETYVSAGLQPPHMRECTYVGVDGVGIGTSLHDYDPNSGLRGQLKAERIREVLTVRDEAAAEPLGRGAQTLARMDRMYFEGTLPLARDKQRIELFDLMRGRQEQEVARLVDEIGELSVTQAGVDHPVIEQANRVVATAKMDTVGRARDRNWDELVTSVERLLETRDIAQLYEVLP